MNCDHNLFLALNFDGGPFMDRLMLTVSGTTMWLPLYALILWLVWRRDGWRNVILFTALMIAALCELPVMFLFTRLVRRVRCDVWLVVSALFMTLRLIFTLVLPGAWGLYLGQLTQSMGFALFAVSTVYYVGSVIEQRNVVKGQTYLGAANTMGNLLAYLIGGILIDGIGTGGMLLTCGIVSALGVLLLILSKERVQQTVGA